jgi:hypothetical protein
MALISGCVDTVHRSVTDLRPGKVVVDVTGYETIDHSVHGCQGKARLQRSNRRGPQPPTDVGIAKRPSDPDWDRYARCLRQREGNEAGAKACAILAPAVPSAVDPDLDLAFRCGDESALVVMPAASVRELRIRDVHLAASLGLVTLGVLAVVTVLAVREFDDFHLGPQ